MSLRLYLVIIVLTTLIALPRFMHFTPDSHEYLAVVGGIQNGFNFKNLEAPYVYRLFVPLLAAFGPTNNIVFNFAIINLICTIIAYIIFFHYLKALDFTHPAASFGVLLLVFSFPTFNYASGVITDPAGFLFLVAGSYALLRERLAYFILIASIGIFVRDANVVLVLILFIQSFLKVYKHAVTFRLGYILAGIPPLLCFVALKIVFSELPYDGSPSITRIISNLSRWNSWVSVALAIIPLVIVSIPGLRDFKNRFWAFYSRLPNEAPDFMISSGISYGTLFIASIVFGWMSGRFLWPLYIVLVPFAASFGTGSYFYKDRLQKILTNISVRHQ